VETFIIIVIIICGGSFFFEHTRFDGRSGVDRRRKDDIGWK
jgi:hypothetical protein